MLLNTWVIEIYCQLFRFFGFFPYTWKVIQDRKLSYKNGSIDFSNNLFLRGWSVIMLFVICCTMGMDFLDSVMYPRNELSSTTLTFAHMMYDVFNSLGILSLQVIGFCSNHRQAELLNFTWQISANMGVRVPSVSRDLKTICLIISGTVYTGSALLVQFWLHPFVTGLSEVVLACRYTLHAPYLILFAMIFQLPFQFASQSLNNLYKYFTKIETNGILFMELDKKLNFEKNLDLDEEPSVQYNSFIPEAKVKEVDEYARVSNLKLDQQNIKDEEVVKYLKDFDFEDIKLKTFAIYDYLKKAETYANPFLLSIIFTLIGNSMVSLFYLSFWKSLDVGFKLISASHLMNAIVPILYLCNIQTCLKNQVIQFK